MGKDRLKFIAAFELAACASFAAGFREGSVYFLTMFAVVLACSGLFYKLIDKPLERIRQAVRSRARSS